MWTNLHRDNADQPPSRQRGTNPCRDNAGPTSVATTRTNPHRDNADQPRSRQRGPTPVATTWTNLHRDNADQPPSRQRGTNPCRDNADQPPSRQRGTNPCRDNAEPTSIATTRNQPPSRQRGPTPVATTRDQPLSRQRGTNLHRDNAEPTSVATTRTYLRTGRLWYFSEPLPAKLADNNSPLHGGVRIKPSQRWMNIDIIDREGMSIPNVDTHRPSHVRPTGTSDGTSRPKVRDRTARLAFVGTAVRNVTSIPRPERHNGGASLSERNNFPAAPEYCDSLASRNIRPLRHPRRRRCGSGRRCSSFRTAQLGWCAQQFRVTTGFASRGTTALAQACCVVPNRLNAPPGNCATENH
jgi:hypothetical protein